MESLLVFLFRLFEEACLVLQTSIAYLTLSEPPWATQLIRAL